MLPRGIGRKTNRASSEQDPGQTNAQRRREAAEMRAGATPAQSDGRLPQHRREMLARKGTARQGCRETGPSAGDHLQREQKQRRPEHGRRAGRHREHVRQREQQDERGSAPVTERADQLGNGDAFGPRGVGQEQQRPSQRLGRVAAAFNARGHSGRARRPAAAVRGRTHRRRRATAGRVRTQPLEPGRPPGVGDRRGGRDPLVRRQQAISGVPGAQPVAGLRLTGRIDDAHVVAAGGQHEGLLRIGERMQLEDRSPRRDVVLHRADAEDRHADVRQIDRPSVDAPLAARQGVVEEHAAQVLRVHARRQAGAVGVPSHQVGDRPALAEELAVQAIGPDQVVRAQHLEGALHLLLVEVPPT